MIILTLRTDKPEAEVGLFDDTNQLQYITWPAHRQLAESLHAQIDTMLKVADKKLSQVQGIVAYQGPGSFTGLRIGLSVANALADSLGLAIIAETGNDWIRQGITKLQQGANQKNVVPEYGSPPHITKPKH